jgi:hypothetical protein
LLEERGLEVGGSTTEVLGFPHPKSAYQQWRIDAADDIRGTLSDDGRGTLDVAR